MTDVARAQLAGGETREDATPTPLHILLLGEGNLSFTHALVRKVVKSSHFGRAASPHGGHGRVCAITATTMDAEKELREKYPECVPILAYFHTKTRVPVRYVGEVNATRIEASLRVGMGEAPPAYDLIFFNNPHVGVEDLYRQRALLSHFFQSAKELNVIHGTFTSSHAQQVIVTLCDDQLHRWAVLDCAARSGYVCVASVPVMPADYPEYANKRHQSDAKFPYQDMFHYYFMQGAQVRCSALEEVMAAYAEINIPQLQMHIWKEIALHHCHGDDEAAGASTGNDSSEVGPYAAQIANDVAAEVASIYSRASSIAIPLLHPKLALYASATAVRKEAEQGSIAASAHYSPYLNVDCIPYLYQLQAKIEMSGVQPTQSSSSPPQVSIPPQLDTRVLGRPLTDREAKKLTRFHEKYGNHAKNDASPHSTSDIHVCSICSPPRSFGCAADLARHNTTHLDSCSRPLMHSQVQHQIIEDGSGAGKQCLICDLRFRREEDYDDHLRFLDPTEFNRRFICSDCNPEKEFADSRALQQHLLHVHVATVGVERSAT